MRFFWQKKPLASIPYEEEEEAEVPPEPKYEYRSSMHIKLITTEELSFSCKSDTEVADPMTQYWSEFLDWYLKSKTAYFLFNSNLKNGKSTTIFIRKNIVNIYFHHTKHEM